MTWHQITVTTNKETAPDVADLFSELGAVAVTFADAEDRPVYEPPPGETVIWDRTQVVALFEMDTEPDLIHPVLMNQFGATLEGWTVEIIEDQVWERVWMEYYHPMLFADRLWVCPTGQEIHEPDKACLILDPGLAFGTGTHATTALCLEWLAKQNLTNQQIIDYGCGSGILGIAGLLLGAHDVLAVDIDEQALTATRDNARKNAVTEQIQTFFPDQLPVLKNDIVLANILAQPLCDLAATIAALVKEDGCLVLSGILREQAEQVMSAYRALGIEFSEPVFQEDWCRLDGRMRT